MPKRPGPPQKSRSRAARPSGNRAQSGEMPFRAASLSDEERAERIELASLAALSDEGTAVVSSGIGTLEVIQGLSTGTHLELGRGTVSLGRSSKCDLTLRSSAGVSRRHSKVVYENGTFFVVDLESRNGTFVNGVEVAGRAKLKDGDVIEISEERILFSGLSPDFSEAETRAGLTPVQPLNVSLETKRQAARAAQTLQEPAPKKKQTAKQTPKQDTQHKGRKNAAPPDVKGARKKKREEHALLAGPPPLDPVHLDAKDLVAAEQIEPPSVAPRPRKSSQRGGARPQAKSEATATPPGVNPHVKTARSTSPRDQTEVLRQERAAKKKATRAQAQAEQAEREQAEQAEAERAKAERAANKKAKAERAANKKAKAERAAAKKAKAERERQNAEQKAAEHAQAKRDAAKKASAKKASAKKASAKTALLTVDGEVFAVVPKLSDEDPQAAQSTAIFPDDLPPPPTKSGRAGSGRLPLSPPPLTDAGEAIDDSPPPLPPSSEAPKPASPFSGKEDHSSVTSALAGGLPPPLLPEPSFAYQTQPPRQGNGTRVLFTLFGVTLGLILMGGILLFVDARFNQADGLSQLEDALPPGSVPSGLSKLLHGMGSKAPPTLPLSDVNDQDGGQRAVVDAGSPNRDGDKNKPRPEIHTKTPQPNIVSSPAPPTTLPGETHPADVPLTPSTTLPAYVLRSSVGGVARFIKVKKGDRVQARTLVMTIESRHHGGGKKLASLKREEKMFAEAAAKDSRAQRDLDEVRAQIRVLSKVQIRRTKVYAGKEGEVVDVLVTEGAPVRQRMPLLRIQPTP